MSATNTFEDGLLTLIFLNSDLAAVGDATGLRGSSTAGSFYIGLHENTLTDTDDAQTTDESTYTSYAREAVVRSGSAWTVSSGTVDNDNAIVFTAATGGSSTVTDFSIGSALSGTGQIFIYGALSAPLAISNGITPQFAAGALDISIN